MTSIPGDMPLLERETQMLTGMQTDAKVAHVP